MKKGRKIAITIIIILLAITTTIGTSYALWTISLSQSDYNQITAGCFSLSFVDTNNESSTSINLTNTFPVSDEVGLNTSPYLVTLTNTCSIAAQYNLNINTSTDNTLEDNYLKSSLKNVTTNTTFSTILLNEMQLSSIDSALKDDILANNLVAVNKTYLLATGILNPTESVTYEFRMWIDETAPNETMGKTFTGVISNEAYASSNRT